MIADYADRHHAFEGCFNFRDVGGYKTRDGRRVKWGRYFRAGRQDRMTEPDLEKVKSLNKALGLRNQPCAVRMSKNRGQEAVSDPITGSRSIAPSLLLFSADRGLMVSLR